jgi:hypothetical protein
VLPLPPSPKSHEYVVMGASPGVEELLKHTLSGEQPDKGVPLKIATGR